MMKKSVKRLGVLLLALTVIVLIWPSIRFRLLPYRAKRYDKKITGEIRTELKNSYPNIQEIYLYEQFGRLYLGISASTENQKTVENIVTSAQNLLNSDEFLTEFFEHDPHTRMQRAFVVRIYFHYRNLIYCCVADYFEQGWTIGDSDAFDHIDGYQTWYEVSDY